MKKQRKSYLGQILLYGSALLVLAVFFCQNAAAWELHLTDVRNSAGKPLPVGATIPPFRMTDSAGRVVESAELPRRYVLVISFTGCPGGEAILEDCGDSGVYLEVPDVYMVYVEAQTPEEREKVAELARRYKKVSVLEDMENSVKWGFRCTGFPTTLIVEDGKVVQKTVGYQEKAYEIESWDIEAEKG